MNLIKKLLTMLVLAIAATTAFSQEAFYIYQNDGHFDGFFYDEVRRIAYSHLDTLGVEHDQYVSQEIVTADSTYRIMLAAIDSVSFVQPEIKLNPQLRDVRKEGLLGYITSRNDLTITFISQMPEDLRPKVGDVLADFDVDEGWGGKVQTVTVTDAGIVVVCNPIEDISDIFQQFVTVEEYDKDQEGNLIRRRTAGMPERTIGTFPRKAEGSWEGTIFNFSLTRHLPIYTSPGGDLNISIDPSIAAALSIKAAWNLPLWGKKQIAITQSLDLELSMGFTVDGKIGDVFPAKVNKFGKMPLPAAAPILVLDFGPDGFLRGEWHGTFHGESPKAKGRVWQKFEINDWWPTSSMGFGKTDEEPKNDEEAEEPNTESLTFEFNGFIQTGMKFPIELRNLPLLDRIFKAQMGGTLYLGPKISGAVAMDVENWADEGFDVYRTFKDSKLTLSPFSADYEIKATVGTLFTSPREWTMMDGSMNMFSNLDLYFFPEFEDFQLKTYTEWNSTEQARIDHTYAVTIPKRNMVWPIQVGVGVYKTVGQQTETIKEEWSSWSWFPTDLWLRQVDNINESCTYLPHAMVDADLSPQYRYYRPLRPGNYTLRPIIKFMGKVIKAEPQMDYTVAGPYLDVVDGIVRIDDKTEAAVMLQTNYDSIKALYRESENVSTTIPYPNSISSIGNGKKKFSIELPKHYDLVKERPYPVAFRGYLLDEKTQTWDYTDEQPAIIVQQPSRQLPDSMYCHIFFASEDHGTWAGGWHYNPSKQAPRNLSVSFVNDSTLHVTDHGTYEYTFESTIVPNRVHTESWAIDLDVNLNPYDNLHNPDYNGRTWYGISNGTYRVHNTISSDNGTYSDNTVESTFGTGGKDLEHFSIEHNGKEIQGTNVQVTGKLTKHYIGSDGKESTDEYDDATLQIRLFFDL